MAATQNYNTPQRQNGSNRRGGAQPQGYGGGLDFLQSNLTAADHRSRSNYIPAQGLGRIGHVGNARVGTYGRFGATGSVARVKNNLYETQRQISRYKNLNKSGTLANRLNRAMPASNNFPESSIREKMTSTGLETSTKFKLSNAENAAAYMNSQ